MGIGAKSRLPARECQATGVPVRGAGTVVRPAYYLPVTVQASSVARLFLSRIAPALVARGTLCAAPTATAQSPAPRRVLRADGAEGIGGEWTTAAASLSHEFGIGGVGIGATRPATARGGFAPPLPALEVAPAGTNLPQGGTRDRGSLASEFYASYAHSRSLEVRAGLGHFLAEIEATPALPSGNARHRRFLHVAFIGISRARPRP
jgi:hypothetical protein